MGRSRIEKAVEERRSDKSDTALTVLTVVPDTATPDQIHNWRGVNPAVSVDDAGGVSVVREASA